MVADYTRVRRDVALTLENVAGDAGAADRAQELATAVVTHQGSERWEPLRDLILAGLEGGCVMPTAARR